MAVNINKLIPSTLSKSLESVQGVQKSSSVTISEKSALNIGIIKVKVVEIEGILKGTIASQKKELDNKKRATSQLRREKLESDLETKPNLNDGKVSFTKAPRMGFLDWIKNFIGKTILGYFAVRMIDYLPKLMPFIKVIGGAADFVINVGGKLLDGLVTFVDWGYKAYDATRGFLKNVGGENFAKRFDEFSGVVNTLVDTLIISAIVLGNQSAGGGGGGGGGRPRGGPRVTQGRGGTSPRFRLPGTGPRVTMGAGGAKGLLSAVRPFLKRIPVPVIAALIDFGLSVALGESPGRAAFRAIGAGLLGYIGAGLSGFLGLTTGPGAVAVAALGYMAGGALGDWAGGALYDIFFGGKTVSKGSPQQNLAGGGMTRGGRSQGRVKRAVGGKKQKGKYKRGAARKPGKVEINSPGSDIGGEKKLFGLFPDPLKALQKVADAINPFKAIKSAGEELGNTNYFGPILAITSKITAGQKPTKQDYQNVGLGINLLVAKGIQDQQLKGGIVAAFAEGGLVDPDVLSAAETGGDISNWVAKTFQGEIESNAQKTLRMIRENAEKKSYDETAPTTPSPGMGGTAGQFSPEGLQGDIYKYLLSKGMSDNHALGIMANIHRESGFRPGVSESGGPGVGLFQYSSGGRKSAFLRAVPDYATNWKGQIDFALKEDVGPQYFRQNFSSPQDAADWWMRNWERPAEYIQNDKGPKIHSQYLAGLQKYKTQKGYEIPTGIASIQLGTGYGSAGSKIAGELGRFIQSKLKSPQQYQAITEHPDFGGVDNSAHAKNSYHKYGRALDIGAYSYEQGPILATIAQFNKLKGVKPVELLKAGDPGHDNHVHVAYEKGGETLGYPHLAMLGEKGMETVIDADSSGPAKDMLLAINQAKDHRGVIKAIQQYAPYDALAPQTIFVPPTSMPGSTEDYGEDGGGLTLIAPATEEGSNPMNVLYKGG